MIDLHLILFFGSAMKDQWKQGNWIERASERTNERASL